MGIEPTKNQLDKFDSAKKERASLDFSRSQVRSKSYAKKKIQQRNEEESYGPGFPCNSSGKNIDRFIRRIIYIFFLRNMPVKFTIHSE